jgi:hypothetical protein
VSGAIEAFGGRCVHGRDEHVASAAAIAAAVGRNFGVVPLHTLNKSHPAPLSFCRSNATSWPLLWG